MNKKLLRLVVLSGIGILAMGMGATAEIPQPQILTLTSRENGTEPETTFFCSGTIYAYVTFPQTESGKHTLEGIWVGPQGAEVRHSREEVEIPPPGRRTAVVWLAFDKNSSVWDPLSLHGAGEADRRAYDGRWEIRVRWDDRELSRSNFTVHCF